MSIIERGCILQPFTFVVLILNTIKMSKKFYFNFILVVLFMIVPSVLFAFEGDPNESPEIEPPPAPIDGALVYLFVGAILLAVYFFYRSNLKIERK